MKHVKTISEKFEIINDCKMIFIKGGVETNSTTLNQSTTKSANSTTNEDNETGPIDEPVLLDEGN